MKHKPEPHSHEDRSRKVGPQISGHMPQGLFDLVERARGDVPRWTWILETIEKRARRT